jgi:hypothetical protein
MLFVYYKPTQSSTRAVRQARVSAYSVVDSSSFGLHSAVCREEGFTFSNLTRVGMLWYSRAAPSTLSITPGAGVIWWLRFLVTMKINNDTPSFSPWVWKLWGLC